MKIETAIGCYSKKHFYKQNIAWKTGGLHNYIAGCPVVCSCKLYSMEIIICNGVDRIFVYTYMTNELKNIETILI